MTTWRFRIGTLLSVMILSALVLGCYLNLAGNKKPLVLSGKGAAPKRTPIYNYQGWIIARGSIHNHTIFSDGHFTPEDLLEMARQEGMAILAITDHREGKICIGKGLCVNAGGVESVGYDKYYEYLRKIQTQASQQGMIALKGVEVSSPYFANYGKFPHLLLWGQYNHFTVYGVEDPAILTNMPARRDLPNFKPEPMAGDTPLQQWVDYLDEHGAIVNVVHPEEAQDEWLGPVHVLTPAPVRNLHLQHINSFSVLPSGNHQRVGAPGGYWDTDLLEYLVGLRDRPVWAEGDADFHAPPSTLAAANTLFYMKEFTEAEVYKCMREGRMVALSGAVFQNTYVAEWWVSDGAKPANPVMLGAEARLSGVPTVRFALDHSVDGAKIRLIRNGKVVAEQAGSELTFKDDELGSRKEPAFYRVEVTGPAVTRATKADQDVYALPDNELFVNPIFVRFNR